MEKMEDGEDIVFLSDEEWDSLIDNMARSSFDISGEEFKRRWRAKDWAFFGGDCPCCITGLSEIGMLVCMEEREE